MTRASRRAVSVACVCALAGCTPPPTQLIVVVDTDLRPSDEIDAVVLHELGSIGPEQVTTVPLIGANRVALPISQGVSTLRPDQMVTVTADAMLGGHLVTSRTVRTGFIAHQTRMLPLFLARACAGLPACGMDETCGDAGSCEGVDRSASDLPTWPGTAPRLSPDAGSVLFEDDFGAGGATASLLTNEYTWLHPADATSIRSPSWVATDGSLFAADGAASTGDPQACNPVDRLSQTCTNSATFRVTTRRADFGDVRVEFDLNVARLVSSSTRPAQPWDGVAVTLRAQPDGPQYYAAIDRRDDDIVVKKVCGDQNEYQLGALAGFPIPVGTLQHVAATVRTQGDGTVTVQLYRDGALLYEARDTGTTGCAPLTAAAGVGILGGNAEFTFDNFRVSPL